MKMPLLQPSFHWIFKERKKFLKGELILIITSNGIEKKITIFKNGKINKEWQELGCHSNHKKNQIYFGFESRNEYLVSETDKVDLILKLDNDIKGIGADSTGILTSGVYKSSTQFTLYHLEKSTREKDVYAFLNNDDWNMRWKLNITSKKGWNEEKYNKKNRDNLIHDKTNYTIGFMIESDGTRTIAVVDHKLKQFYFEHFRNHHDFLTYIKVNKAKMPLIISCTGKVNEKYIKTCKDLESVLAPIKLSYYNGKQFIGPKGKDWTEFYYKYGQK
ncbi:MAG: hypothetical protein L3J71_12480 [Victivallaceae bacterium]|nr:hypothetical protein [Victivallaceae bacterium]